MATKAKAVPELAQEGKEVQDLAQAKKPTPSTAQKKRELPAVGKPENTVTIGGKLVEIKPMRLEYQRNRTASFYHVLELYPLPDILAMENPFGDGRDGDKALCDWLVAVTDDEELIRENLDSIDTDTIYQMLAIFKRINRISEMEEKLKNARTPGAKAD